MDAFTIISEPSRRVLLSALLGGEAPVNKLVEISGMSQPVVSKHLRVLREAGVVAVRPDGQRRLYRLEGAPLEEAIGSGVHNMFHNSGQSCNAPSRMLVPESRYEEAVAIKRLNTELERAVMSEDYERAAELRDRLKDFNVTTESHPERDS